MIIMIVMTFQRYVRLQISTKKKKRKTPHKKEVKLGIHNNEGSILKSSINFNSEDKKCVRNVDKKKTPVCFKDDFV